MRAHRHIAPEIVQPYTLRRETRSFHTDHRSSADSPFGGVSAPTLSRDSELEVRLGDEASDRTTPTDCMRSRAIWSFRSAYLSLCNYDDRKSNSNEMLYRAVRFILSCSYVERCMPGDSRATMYLARRTGLAEVSHLWPHFLTWERWCSGVLMASAQC